MMLVGAMQTAPDGVTKVAGIVAGHFGTAEAGAAAIAPIKKFGHPMMDVLGPIPYTQLNMMLDPSLPRGARNYWKAHFLPELSDGAIDALVDGFAATPSPMAAIVIEHFHGAATRVPVGDTAFTLRTPQMCSCSRSGRITPTMPGPSRGVSRRMAPSRPSAAPTAT
jgi:hypothetical protein